MEPHDEKAKDTHRGNELSDYQRGMIVGMSKYNSNMSSIARELGLGEATVRATINRVKRTGTALTKKRSGRPPVLSDKNKQILSRIVLSNQKASLKDIAIELQSAVSVSDFASIYLVLKGIPCLPSKPIEVITTVEFKLQNSSIFTKNKQEISSSFNHTYTDIDAPFGFYTFFNLSPTNQYTFKDNLYISIDIKIWRINSFYGFADFVIPRHFDSSKSYDFNKKPAMRVSDVDVTLSTYYNSQSFHRFYGHKLTLSAASDFFASLFNDAFGPSSKGEVTIFSVDPYIFGRLIYYIYADIIEIKSIEDAKELLLAADYLQLPKAVYEAEVYLQKEVTPFNIWSSWEWAIKCGFDRMANFYKECFSRNFELLLSQPGLVSEDKAGFIQTLTGLIGNCLPEQQQYEC
ncbi:BTB/POZ domain-containing protein [Phycomyces nitens]|nr:BTB/POZ domain-containing protein [Phycomyces nitens]